MLEHSISLSTAYFNNYDPFTGSLPYILSIIPTNWDSVRFLVTEEYFEYGYPSAGRLLNLDAQFSLKPSYLNLYQVGMPAPLTTLATQTLLEGPFPEFNFIPTGVR